MNDARRQLVSIALAAALAGGGYFAFEHFGAATPAAEAFAPTTARDVPPGARAAEDAPEKPRPEERFATLETDEFIATVSNYSTAITSVRLKGERFQTDDGRPIELVTTDREDYLPFRPELEGVPIPRNAVWEMEQPSPTEVRFRWSGGGFVVVRKLEAGKGPYQIWSTLRVRNQSEQTHTVRSTLSTHHYVRRADEGGGFFARPSPARSLGVCQYGEEVLRKEREDLLEGASEGPNVRFAAVETTYFATAIAADQPLAERCTLKTSDRGGTLSEPDGGLFEVRVAFPKVELAPGEETTVRALGYFGPKDPATLEAAGHGLSKLVDLGFFAWIAEYLVRLLGFIHGLVGNWGLAIILLTVLVKVVLWPLTEKSFQSMARMRLLKPEMDRVNELYADDREKKAAALMELYRKHKINPLGGCLPTLLQLPIWFALYQSLLSNTELYHAPFALWWQDLSSPDPYFVLPAILGGMMFLQQKLTPTSMDPAQAKIMLYLMPVMITGFMLFLPAGLTLYMVTNSALGIAQQKWIHWRLDRHSSAAGPDTAGTSLGTEPEPQGAGAGASGAAESSRPKARSGKQRRQRRGRA